MPTPPISTPTSTPTSATCVRFALAALFTLVPLAARAGSTYDAGAPAAINAQMVRSAGMGGAHVAIVSGNDAILLNPAGLAQSRKYHLEIDGLYDAKFPAEGVIVSIADSTSIPNVGTGIMFTRWGAGEPAGREEGWFGGLSYAYELGGIYFGGQTKYLRMNGPDGQTRQFVQDTGVLVKRGGFSYAAVLQNLSIGGSSPLFPANATTGIAFGNDQDWRLAFDYRADLADLSNIKHRFAAGTELLFEQALAVRAGFTYDPAQHYGWFSAGIGIVSEKLAVQVALRRRVIGTMDQFLMAGVTLFLE